MAKEKLNFNALKDKKAAHQSIQKAHEEHIREKAKKPGGRKPKDPRDKRSEKTTINFTPAEKEKLEELIEMGEASYTSIVIKALKAQGII